jgi:predicted nucleic acid-binding protein
MLEPSYEAAKIGGEIYAGLKKEGRLINDADILIASIVTIPGLPENYLHCGCN